MKEIDAIFTHIELTVSGDTMVSSLIFISNLIYVCFHTKVMNKKFFFCQRLQSFYFDHDYRNLEGKL